MKNVLAGRNERGLYKMICDAETGKVVGLHMIGPDAPEILQAAAVVVTAGLTKQAFDDTVAMHPSMAEELVLMRSGDLKILRIQLFENSHLHVSVKAEQAPENITNEKHRRSCHTSYTTKKRKKTSRK